ncbi:anthranilate phosphoribosyltransferase, partial [Helicobacter typhlonius]
TREIIPIKQYLKSTLKGENLSFKQAYDVMDEITEGNMSDAQIGSILTSLEIKGVNAEELAGFASVLKKKAIAFPLPLSNEVRLDMVGTGGSPHKTFNVSTTSALLLAAAGVKIIKHGNRAITSKSGSADLLSALGVNINMEVQTCIDVYKNIGITFLFAQKFHAAMRFAAPARATLGFKTAFNLIGPLANPANVTHQFIGVFDKAYTEIMARALDILGIKRAMVVSGFDYYDEISLCAPTQITELNNGVIKSYVFNPSEIGLDFVPYTELCGGDVQENKRISLDIFSASPQSLRSPKTQLVALNTGAALYLAGKAQSIKEGYFLARDIIESKRVFDVLEDFVRLSNQ